MARPSGNDYPAFYQGYVNMVAGDAPYPILLVQYKEMDAFMARLTEEVADYAYAPGKWNIREVLQHLIDAERVFAYRALWIARGAQAPLPGYDENDFADKARQTLRTLSLLKEELLLVRQTTLHLFDAFTQEILERKGFANNAPVTVNALGFIIAGHFAHHRQILLERYLN